MNMQIGLKVYTDVYIKRALVCIKYVNCITVVYIKRALVCIKYVNCITVVQEAEIQYVTLVNVCIVKAS